MLTTLGWAAAAAAGTAGPRGPPVTAYLHLAPGNCTVFRFSAPGCGAGAAHHDHDVESDSGGSGCMIETVVAAGPAAPSCLSYGGYSEGNTGLAACKGWSAAGIGGQLWAVAAAGNTTRLGLTCCGTKLFGAANCGGSSLFGGGGGHGGAPLETCNSDGGDCSSAGCPGAFAWTLRPVGPALAAQFVLESVLPAPGGKMQCVSECPGCRAPPGPRPKGAPVRPSGGGGPWTMACNSTAACPADQTCCKLASSNFGCCPGPNATCCPGGVTCCPHGYECHKGNPDADPAYNCKAPPAPRSPRGGFVPATVLEAASAAPALVDEDKSFGARALPNWPPGTAVHPSALRQPLGDLISRLPQAAGRVSAGTPLTVTSTDGTTAVTIDSGTGDLITVDVKSPAAGRAIHSFQTRAMSMIGNLTSADPTSRCKVVVSREAGAAVRVVRRCSSAVGGGGFEIVEQYAPDDAAPAAVLLQLSVAGLASKPLRAGVAGLDVTTVFSFDPAVASELQWWAPWDRDSYSQGTETWTDPLSPSDGKTGFWPGQYTYGIVYAHAGADMVVAPLVAVLHPGSDTGFSMQMNPADPGLAWGDSFLESSKGGFGWHRQNLKISSDTVHSFTIHIAGHAACWRPALGFSIGKYPRHWKVAAAQAKVDSVDGLGSCA
eukprot:SAG22_NODE_552_length_9177_cov_15.661489_5_plen_659_part_00